MQSVTLLTLSVTVMAFWYENMLKISTGYVNETKL